MNRSLPGGGGMGRAWPPSLRQGIVRHPSPRGRKNNRPHQVGRLGRPEGRTSKNRMFLREARAPTACGLHHKAVHKPIEFLPQLAGAVRG